MMMVDRDGIEMSRCSSSNHALAESENSKSRPACHSQLTTLFPRVAKRGSVRNCLVHGHFDAEPFPPFSF